MAARKKAAKKTAAKKRGAKTAAPRKAAARKSAARKSAAKKVARKTSTAKKSPAKKSAAKKTAGRRPTRKTARGGHSERTTAGSAGTPVQLRQTRARAAANATPSAADLDIRDRLKAGPRRPAGPPLVGDIMTRATMEALRKERPPRPTDPTPAPEEG